MALKQRQAAVQAYESNPNICKACSQPIPIQPGQKVAEVRHKQFCSRSCAAKINNHIHPKRKPEQDTWSCVTCGETFHRTECASGRRSTRCYCNPCLAKVRASRKGVEILLVRTKGELFENRKNWQSARTTIAKHARQVLLASKRSPSCEAPDCGYSNHVDICHRRSVASFPDETLIQDINDLSNLLFLCPNHHWEFDHPHNRNS